MSRYIFRRSVSGVLLLLAVSLATFFLIFAGGDPATRMAGESGSVADIARIREAYGFDRPIIMQYLSWLGGSISGDLGRSLYFNLPVSSILFERLGATMRIGACAIVLAIMIGVSLGIAAGCRPNTRIDRFALIFAVIGQALPTFWFALLLVILFSVEYPILPSSGLESWRHYIMPTVVLSYFAAPAIMRLTRSGMINVLDTDYIRTARAMGLLPRKVLMKYALRNALIPVVSLSAAQFGYMLAGSVVVESVFAINGAGRLAWESILRSDLPVIQALVLCFSLIYIVLTFLADILNAWLDPRMRMS
jgi:peptide/nickel transport system permease protein